MKLPGKLKIICVGGFRHDAQSTISGGLLDLSKGKDQGCSSDPGRGWVEWGGGRSEGLGHLGPVDSSLEHPELHTAQGHSSPCNESPGKFCRCLPPRTKSSRGQAGAICHLATRPPWGKALSSRRINDTGTRAHHHFSEVSSLWIGRQLG